MGLLPYGVPLNCTLTMNFVKLFVLIHSLIPIPLTLKTLKWMFMRQQPPKGSASGFLHSESSNQTSQWACGANCCRSVWAEEVIKPPLCMIATSLFGTQQPQSLHLFCSRSLHPLKVGGIFCNPVGDGGPLRIPARLRVSESCVLRWLVSTCHGCSQWPRVASREGPGERLSKQQMVLLALWDRAAVGHQRHSKSLSLCFHLHLIHCFSVEENQY